MGLFLGYVMMVHYIIVVIEKRMVASCEMGEGEWEMENR